MSRRPIRILLAAVIFFSAYWYLTVPGRSGACHEAFVTVVSSGIYLPGAVVLAHSLHLNGGRRDLIALVPEGTVKPKQLAMLSKVGWNVREVPSISLPQGRTIDARFEDMLVKLYAFNMLQYNRIALIDADAYVVGRLDEAFALLAASSAPLAATLAPTKAIKPFYDDYAGHFNGGVVLLKPDASSYSELVYLSANASYYDSSLAEQSLLNHYFGGRWLGLPASFNLIYMHRHVASYWKSLRPSAKVVHFAGVEKPWHGCEQDPLLCGAAVHPEVHAWRKTLQEAYRYYGFVESDFAGEEEETHFNIRSILQ